MKTIKQTYVIKSSIEEVWKALVDVHYIDGWGGGPAKMDDKKGTKFSLWGGSIWGENLEVVPNKKLVQHWYSDEENKWEKPSKLTFTLHTEKDSVRLELIHENIPDENVDDIDQGWKDYYLGPLKNYLESN
jgi:activator of HSP90 ATPase